VTDQVERSGDDLLAAIAALANPIRLRIIATLTEHRQYVSQLARDLGISRPLLHMHLQRLEAAGLVSTDLELSDSGKAVRYVEVRSFRLELTPAAISRAVPTITDGLPSANPKDKS